MGNTIRFPEPYDRLVYRADKAVEQKEWLQAKKFYQDASAIKSSYSLNRKLVYCYQQLGSYADALFLAQDFLPEYLKNEQGFSQYEQLLILDTQYLRAHNWLQKGKEIGVDQASIKQHQEELSLLEQAHAFFEQDLLTEKKREFLVFDKAYQPVSSIHWTAFIKGITKAAFVQWMHESLFAVKNPFLKPKLIEELVKLKVPEVFTVKDYTETIRKIIPAELVLPEASFCLQMMTKEITEQLGQDDPILAENILMEIRGHLAIGFPTYPEKDEILLWIQSYLADYAEGFVQPENQQIQDKKKLLRKIIWKSQGYV